MFLNKFNFVWLALFFHQLKCFIGRKFKSFNRIIFLNNNFHFLFYFIKVILCEMSINIKIIIKTVFNSRADSKFCVWIKPFNSLCHYMRCSVVKRLFTVFIIKCKYFKITIAFNNGAQICNFTVYTDAASVSVKSH